MFGPSANAGVSEFASLAVESGHKRWRRHSGASSVAVPRRLKGPAELNLVEATTLMLRLRAGFGVGVKADLLSFLLGIRGARATISAISKAIGYTGTAVRAAAEDMAVGRLIQKTRDGPAEYFARPMPWAELLELERRPIERRHQPGGFDPPVWRHWVPVFAFLDWVHRWAGEASSETSAYLLSSQARDLFEEHRDAFLLNGIVVPDPADYPGAGYLEAFQSTVLELAGWLEDCV